MGVTQRRARAKAHLKTAILDAARELFATEDYAAVSIRRIADKIEYSPTTIYLYFKDKQEILFHLIDESNHALADRLEACTATDPLERLRLAGRAYLDFALTQPRHFRLMFFVEDPALAVKCASLKSIERSFHFLGRTLTDGQARGQVRDDIPMPLLVHSAWAHLHGAAALAVTERLVHLPADAHATFFEAHLQLGIDALRP